MWKFVYMKPPEFMVEVQSHQDSMLRKTPYRLKESSRIWQAFFAQLMEKMRTQRTSSNACVIEVSDVVIGFYVDDLLINGLEMESRTALQQSLTQLFPTNELVEPADYEWVQIVSTGQGIAVLRQKCCKSCRRGGTVYICCISRALRCRRRS